ncbi:MAG: permease [Lentisphaerae bacterium]|nr:permease [Lentisphaerota bacterium]
MMMNILKEIWLVTVAMAPYLLFGFLAAGILSVLISKEYVRRHLGGSGWKPSVKAALIGVPMPICSCGVIPLAAALRKQGAGRGATASFLASTPQTGVDSLMITYALLGGVFAVSRALIAFLSGILCGAAVGAISPKENEQTEETSDDESDLPTQIPVLKRILRYGFISLPRKISGPLIFGIIVSGIISSIVNTHIIPAEWGNSPWILFLMLAVGIPFYVCSSASVPIAFALIKAGISPGAALVFLIAGPAVNAATLTTLWKIIGRNQAIVFLFTLGACALAAGFAMNLFTPKLGIMEQVCHDAEHGNPLNIFWAILVIVVLLKGIFRWDFRKNRQHTQ